MKRLVLLALACFAAAGCKKKNDDPAPVSQGGSGFGAEQGVRGAVNRLVTSAELKDLHLFMTHARGSLDRLPTKRETIAALSEPTGNPKLLAMINDGSIVLVDNPPEEGIWAYAKEAPTHGGWILMHSEPRRVTAQEFAQLSRQ